MGSQGKTFLFIEKKEKSSPDSLLQDGSKKIILNADAFKETDNKDLQGFLQYVKTGKIGQPHQKYLRWLHSFCAKFYLKFRTIYFRKRINALDK